MRINIQYKITFIIGIIVAIILCGIFLYLNNGLKNHTFDSVKIRLKKETSLVKSFIENESSSLNLFSVKYGSREAKIKAVDKIADEIGGNLEVRVTFIDLDGRVLGDSKLNEKEVGEIENHLLRPEVQDAINYGTGESRRFSTTVKKDMLYEAYLYGKPVPLGVIRLSSPLSEITIISKELKNLLIVSLLFGLIFTFIISFVVSLFISKPIKTMSIVAANIANGELSKRIPINSNDEIGDMAKAFNYMTKQIKLRIEEITLSKLRFEGVILSMFEGVMVVDLKGFILLMNQTLKDLLLVNGPVIGKRPIDVMHHFEIQDIADIVIKRNQGVESREITIFNKKEKILLVHATPVLRDHIIEGAVLVFHDITELRHLEEVRKDFVANVSHELRTPMSNIKGYSETLVDGALDDKENAMKFLKIINNESIRMAKLIDDILDMSKIESGSVKLKLQPLQIKSVVAEVVEVVENLVKSKTITLIDKIPENLPNVFADEAKISQVLLNLLDNAIKYNKPDGEVVISAKEINDCIQIDVTDNGIGILETDSERIFERFYRADKARSRKIGGTGLGLSIVKHIVQAHKGTVFVKSVFGKGSTFSFTLPKV